MISPSTICVFVVPGLSFNDYPILYVCARIDEEQHSTNLSVTIYLVNRIDLAPSNNKTKKERKVREIKRQI
jgi:hypothetical protein